MFLRYEILWATTSGLSIRILRLVVQRLYWNPILFNAELRTFLLPVKDIASRSPLRIFSNVGNTWWFSYIVWTILRNTHRSKSSSWNLRGRTYVKGSSVFSFWIRRTVDAETLHKWVVRSSGLHNGNDSFPSFFSSLQTLYTRLIISLAWDP